MGWLWIGLLALAIAVLVLAEWPRLAARLPLDGRAARRGRRRAKSRPTLRVVTPAADDADDDPDDFAASVERDLAQLPTTQERDRNR